jgi:hypothetical protein
MSLPCSFSPGHETASVTRKCNSFSMSLAVSGPIRWPAARTPWACDAGGSQTTQHEGVLLRRSWSRVGGLLFHARQGCAICGRTQSDAGWWYLRETPELSPVAANSPLVGDAEDLLMSWGSHVG